MSDARTINADPLAGHPFADALRARRSWYWSLRRLARLLGIHSTEEPQRLRIPHPVDQLIFHNFTICELHRGLPGREYMSLNDVEVVRKNFFRELHGGLCEYRFELKAAPDSIWQFFFKRLVAGINVRFENRMMVLCCFPGDLGSIHHEIKNAIARANTWHAEDREELQLKISAQIDELRAARNLGKSGRSGCELPLKGRDS